MMLRRFFLFAPIFTFVFVIGVFFSPVFLSGKVPLPADALVGMYHPWRDVRWGDYGSGVGVKNPLITDPIRQQYVWRELAVHEIRHGRFPSWNPYSFSGTPLFANFQTAIFYPLNILFFFLPFSAAWTVLVISQPLLGGIFLFSYLRYLGVSRAGCFLASVAFSFSGTSISWLEWNTIGHVMLWLPLLLLAKEKLLQTFSYRWAAVLFFAEISSFFAGHLQIFFYIMGVSSLYLFGRIVEISLHSSRFFRTFFSRLLPFFFIGTGVFFLSLIQLIPTLRFIHLSAREFDQGGWMQEGWFLPWQHLIQFVAPDFFGNPTTANYWGTWNYGEFVGYIGILPLIFVFFSLFSLRDFTRRFFASTAVFGLLFALPNFFSKLPYLWNVSFLSTSQPTRLLSVVTFSLSILSGFGFDAWRREKKKRYSLFVFLTLLLVFLLLWIWTSDRSISWWIIDQSAKDIARRNLLLPSFLLLCSFSLFSVYQTLRITGRKRIVELCIFCVVIFDLLRFSYKFTPFSDPAWVYPPTRLLQRLSDTSSVFRVMSTDRRILPDNVSVHYRLHNVSGYDPLYLLSYNKLSGAWMRNSPDISPSSFHRIVTPENYESFLADFMGIRYVLTYGASDSKKLQFLDHEGQTYLYENPDVFPRAFFVEQSVFVDQEDDQIDEMFRIGRSLRVVAVTSRPVDTPFLPLQRDESVDIISYQPSYISIRTFSVVPRLLVVTDPYYPTWYATIDDTRHPIIPTDFLFRGVVVPEGQHSVEFFNAVL